MSRMRERRPSMAQRPVLVAIADLIERTGQPARHGDVLALIDERGERRPQVAQWCAIAESGAAWVTTDRGTEDNRGGIQSEYRYTLTPAGWAIIDREPPARLAERVEVGAAGCGCPVTEEMRLNAARELHSSIEGTERTEHRPGCWDAPKEDEGCTYDMSDPSHGPMSCGNETERGSEFCPQHVAEVAALEALEEAGVPVVEVDPAEVEADIDAFMAASEPERSADRLAAGIVDVKYNPETDRYEGLDGKEDPYRRHLRHVEESSPAAFWGES